MDKDTKHVPVTAAVHLAMKKLAVEKEKPLRDLTTSACRALLKRYGIDCETLTVAEKKRPGIYRE